MWEVVNRLVRVGSVTLRVESPDTRAEELTERILVLTEAGMPLLAALDASREATGDRAIGERLSRVREQVAGGSPLTAALEREHALTPVTHQLIAVGDGSGQLASMTARAGDLASREAERQVKTLVSVLEPALIVAFGGLVAFVAAALLQAVYGLRV